ncbi:hypothetical protein F5Y08DRAFT_328857 [Xylaria arbuscula]|nr:hypothetical protein F5Y08DRAFT_328857 [Xylaria arbuscula]
MSVPPSRRLVGKVAIVTGSSSGLGRAIALSYSQEGAFVVCADLKPEARVDVESEVAVNTDDLIRRNGGSAIYVKADMTVAADVEELVQETVRQFGRLDIMINNAGISLEAGHAPQKIHETAESRWDTTMAVNVKSVFLGCKFATAQMLKQELPASGDRGWIINISSIFGLIGGKFNSSYAASKGAVSNLTRQVAIDYADSAIHCNAICPGYTNTAIFVNTIKFNDKDKIEALPPLHGIGSPQDIVGAAIFLASHEAKWITGVCLPVDGGYTAQ